MDWQAVILEARDQAEIRTGYTPTHVVVRREIYGALALDPVTENIEEIWEIGGMKVSAADYLDQPYLFLINIDEV